MYRLHHSLPAIFYIQLSARAQGKVNQYTENFASLALSFNVLNQSLTYQFFSKFTDERTGKGMRSI